MWRGASFITNRGIFLFEFQKRRRRNRPNVGFLTVFYTFRIRLQVGLAKSIIVLDLIVSFDDTPDFTQLIRMHVFSKVAKCM